MITVLSVPTMEKIFSNESLPYVGRSRNDFLRNLCVQSGRFQLQGCVYRYANNRVRMEGS